MSSNTGEGMPSGWTPATENDALSSYLLIICGAVAGLILVWRLTIALVKHVRTVAGLANERQQYFALTSAKSSWFKRDLLYAPLFRKRHQREFQLTRAINVGTLPTRFQFIFLLAYLATNVGFCVTDIPFSSSFEDAGKQLRNRSGTLAVVNMIPLLVMAGRSNPLIKLTGISFPTFNLLHRWFGRIVALEAVCHVLAYLAVAGAGDGGWGGALQGVTQVPYQMFGLIAVCAFVAITIQAASVARHAFYESFKLMHIGLAILAIVGLWYHLNLKNLPQIKWLVPVIVIWIAERLMRIVLLLWHNIGRGGTQTLVETLPGNACRVTVTMARPWTFRPGQYAFVYMPTISFWQSHPFSLAWSEESEDPDSEKFAMTRQDVLAAPKTTMSFVIRARTGFTQSLYQKAAGSPDGRLFTTCLVEGPYGGLDKLHSYGTVMLFAGGAGITHQVPHVRDLVAGYANGTVATRKVVLVWIIQSPEHLEWIRPWMTEILSMEGRRDVLRVMLFVSRPHSSKEIQSPSTTVQMFPGRPDVENLLATEMTQQVGAMGVTVCGPGALSDQVRQAVRSRQFDGNVDFIDEAFSW